MAQDQDHVDPFQILGGASNLVYNAEMSEDEKQLWADFEVNRDLAVNSKTQRERQWDFYRYYLQGELLARDRITSEVYRVITDESARQAFAQDNKLRPVSRAYVGKHIRSIPTAAVRPRSGDREDMLAAEVMDSFIDFFEMKEMMRVKYKRAIEFLPWAGNAFFQPFWDSDGGQEVAWCPKEDCGFYSDQYEEGDPCPQCELEYQVQMQEMQAQTQQRAQEAIMKGADPRQIEELTAQHAMHMSQYEPTKLIAIKEGDVCTRVVDPRDFFVDPGATEIEDAQWCYVRKVLPVNVIRRMFPEKANLVSPESELQNDRSIVYSGSILSAQADIKYLENHAYLYEYHEMPSGKYPQGLLIYFSSDRVLRIEENPYVELFGQLPFFPIRADRRPGEFWAEPPIEQAWPLQRERNKLATQMRQHRDLTNNPKLLSPRGNGINVDYMDTVPGQVIKFKAMAGKPSYLNLPPFPSYAFDELNRLELAIKEKFGVTDQEMGISQGDPSGRYAAILEAQSSESINTQIMENNAYMMRFYRAVLLLAQKYYHPDRRWAIQGQDRVKTYFWDRVNIRGGWDVSIREGDSLSRNPALRRQEALAMLQQGAFMDPSTGQPDLKRFWRMAGVIEVKAGYDDESNERTFAASIPEMFARGKQITPQPEDDAQIIAEELLGWLRGPGRAGADPRVVEQVRQLWMQFTQAMQGAQQGAPPQGGGNQPGQAPIPATAGGGQAPGPSGASEIIAQADQAGEAQANPQGVQEN